MSTLLRRAQRLYSSSARRPRPRKSSGAQAAQDSAAPLAVRPQEWVEVQDKKTGGVYHWNAQTGETTAVGEPRPGPEGRAPPQPVVVSQRTSLLGLIAMGGGVGLVFSLLGRIF